MKKQSKGQKVLQHIKDSNGLRFGEIQRFICELNGYDYDKFQIGYDGKRVRVNRGYWCTNLSVILNAWCHKREDNGKWYCYHVPKHPFADVAHTLRNQAYAIKSLQRQYKKSGAAKKKMTDRAHEYLNMHLAAQRQTKELEHQLNEAVTEIADLQNLLAATRHPVNR